MDEIMEIKYFLKEIKKNLPISPIPISPVFTQIIKG
jgi:hypothetical protein